jgi:peptidoglycan/xylan/chitin deacetylase (PgdA/CDA1 family)
MKKLFLIIGLFLCLGTFGQTVISLDYPDTIYYSGTYNGIIDIDDDVVYLPLSTLKNINENTEFDKAIVVIATDDGYETNYTNLKPILDARGLKATFYINGSFIGNTNYLTWEQLQELYEDGYDLQSHSFRHWRFDTLTKSEIISEIVKNDSAFLANDIALPRHFAYPEGVYNDYVRNVVDSFYLTSRSTLETYYNYPKGDRYALTCKYVNFLDDLDDVKDYFDALATAKGATIMFSHQVLGAPTVEYWTNVISYIQDTLDLQILTMDQLYDSLFYLQIAAYRPEGTDSTIELGVYSEMDSGDSIVIERSTDGINYTELTTLPNTEKTYDDEGLSLSTNYFYKARGKRGNTYYDYCDSVCNSTAVMMTLTATGTGTGVATLKLKPYNARTVTLTVDGNAHFYTDAGGTLGESTTRTITNTGSVSTIYIKCTSGTANLKISENSLETITEYTAPTNAPTLGGSLTSLSKLTTIILAASTTSCDISKLPALFSLTIGGSGANYTGSINDLHLTTLNVTGGNNLSGSFNSNHSGLTRAEVYGNNTISGTTAYFSNCTRVYMAGLNTVTYATFTWSNSMNYFRIIPATGHGWSVADITLCLIDADKSTWAGSSRTLNLGSPNSSMANTTQGGIWGDFDGETSPSALAIAYKSLMRSKSVTVTLNGITAPGGSGDGTGFPAGFGDWYRL